MFVMSSPTDKQIELLRAIARSGGEGRSIFNLGVRLAGHDYHAAHDRMLALAARGLVTINDVIGRRGSEFKLTTEGIKVSTMKAIVVDPGFGNTKVCSEGRVAVLQSAVSVPSRMGTAFNGRVATATHVEFDKRTYAVGMGAWQLGEPLQSMDYLALVSQPRLALMYAGIAQVLPPADHGDVQLVVALPVPLMQDDEQMKLVKSQAKELKREHRWTIDGQEWRMNVVAVSLRGQPFGAFFDWLYNDELMVREGGVKRSVFVLDIGMKTIDLCALENGELSRRFLGGDASGVYRLFDDKLSQGFDLVELDHQLRNGEIKLSRAERDIWLGVILDVLERKAKTLRRFHVVIPTGGGVAILGQQLFDVLAAKGAALYMPQNINDCISANVRGLWKHAAHEQRAAAVKEG